MPGRDGTGPAGAGMMSGRGMGRCATGTDDVTPRCGGQRRMRMGRRGASGRGREARQ